MKFQLIVVSAICLTYVVYSLPIPDEEVSAAQAGPASEVQLDIAKKTKETPIEPVISAKTVETRTVEESKPIAKLASHPSSISASSANVNDATKSEIVEDINKTGPKTDIKLDAPDAETAPAIPEKNAIVEEKDIIKPAAAANDIRQKDVAFIAVPELKKDQSTLDENKNEKKVAARTETEEHIEAPKAVALVEAPAANAEVQKQVVDEAKPAVHLESTALVGKLTELTKVFAATTITNKAEEKKLVKEKDTKISTEKAPAKKIVADEEINESISELKSNKNEKEKEKATSVSPFVSVEPVALADPAAADISSVIVQSAQEEKKLIAEEKQPARQERINEHEKDASTSVSSGSNIATDATTTNETKSEGTVRVTPRGHKSENKNVAYISETTSALDPNKIQVGAASAKTAQENKVENDTKKTITETEQQLLQKTDDIKMSSEEKSSSEKKYEVSNDSAESKESDESDSSKEYKSN